MNKKSIELILKDLERLAEANETSAEEHAINGEARDIGYCDGKASAYRHTIKLVRTAMKNGGE